MCERDLQGLLAAAQLRVGGARALLARPRACPPDECVTLLREAQGYMEWFRDSLPKAGPVSGDLRQQAAVLAGEVQQAGILLEGTARRGRRWLENLRSFSPEYTASGGRLARPMQGRLSYTG